MSRENVDVVRRAYEFLGRGELPFEVTDPEIRIDNIPDSPIPGPYYGHGGMRRWWSEIADALPGFRLTLEEVIDVGDDRVVGVLKTHGDTSRPGAVSTLIEQMPTWAAVHWVRNGLVVRTAGYLTKEQALKAAGLREKDTHSSSS